MFRTLNMGVGMVVIMGKADVDKAIQQDPDLFILGEVVAGRGVQLQ